MGKHTWIGSTGVVQCAFTNGLWIQPTLMMPALGKWQQVAASAGMRIGATAVAASCVVQAIAWGVAAKMSKTARHPEM